MAEPLEILRAIGEHVPPAVREQIVALGADAIPGLIAILEEDELALLSGQGEGWPPIHAVDLLADMHATTAIEPMLDVFERTDLDDVLSNRIVVRLSELGPSVVEPVLARLARATDEDRAHALCEILAGAGVRDDRIFVALVRLLDEHPVLAASLFERYGDPDALHLLFAELERFQPDFSSRVDRVDLMTLTHAIEELGGTLSPDLQQRVDGWCAEWDRRERLGGRKKVGRNEPCPCGSGRKYKRCCET